MTVIQATGLPDRPRYIWPKPTPDSWRGLADALSAHPDLAAPHSGSDPLSPLNVFVETWDDPAFTAWAAILTAPVESRTSFGARLLTGRLGNLHIAVSSSEKREAA